MYNDPIFFYPGQMTLRLRSLFSLEIHARNNQSKQGSKRTWIRAFPLDMNKRLSHFYCLYSLLSSCWWQGDLNGPFSTSGSRGGAHPTHPPHFKTKLRPKGPKNIFWRPSTPYLMTAYPTSSLSESLDLPKPLPIGEESLKCYLPSKKNNFILLPNTQMGLMSSSAKVVRAALSHMAPFTKTTDCMVAVEYNSLHQWWLHEHRPVFIVFWDRQ